MARFLARPAQGEVYFATAKPACVDGSPREATVIDGADAADCDTGGGGYEVKCLCLDGVWINVATGSGAGGGYATCQEEGSSLTQRSTLNFVGASVTCADAGGKTVCTFTDSDTDTKIILDLGDDGGNDSTALAEIATLADDYSVVTEPSADKTLIDFSKIPPYRQYDPDREPSVCVTDSANNWCENWTGDTEALTWSWFNQDSAAVSYARDQILLDGDTTEEYHGRIMAPPSSGNVDFTIIAKMSTYSSTAAANSCGLVLFHSGTLGSPLAQIGNLYHHNGAFAANTDADLNSGSGVGNGGTFSIAATYVLARTVYLKLSYVDSTRVVTASFSWEGKSWYAFGSSTAGADPIGIGIETRRDGTCFFDWWRMRTDANREEAGE